MDDEVGEIGVEEVRRRLATVVDEHWRRKRSEKWRSELRDRRTGLGFEQPEEE